MRSTRGWTREFPGCPFERYADDIVAHCGTEEQARVLLAAIAGRLGTLGLELHPVKTKIVFCKDANRRGDFAALNWTTWGSVRLNCGQVGWRVIIAASSASVVCGWSA